jgi:hypothetical protein
MMSSIDRKAPVSARLICSLTALIAVLALPVAALAQAAPPPRAVFDLDPKPPAPDYADPANWASLPATRDAADLAPPNSRYPEGQGAAGVDVFFIHPTTVTDKAHWNQAVTDAATNRWTDVSVIARQATAFNACCRVYAPRYRQAGSGAVDAMAGDGGKAYNLAYGDVRAAFQYYLDHDNHGRPFILAGHSQGALLLDRLVAEMIDGKPLRKRFVAGYAMGGRTLMGDFGAKYKTVQPCRTPSQTGCLVGWNTYERGGDPSAYKASVDGLDAAQYGLAGKVLLCVNPLTFDMSKPRAAAAANQGALSGAPAPEPLAAGVLPPVAPGAAGADCQDGVLMADLPHGEGLAWTTLPKGSMHMHDVDTFYENLRANAVLRARTFLSTHRTSHGG